MENIVIIGGGGHAKVLISIIRKSNNYAIVGYTDNTDRGEILGQRYLGNDDVLEDLISREVCNLAAIGVGQVTVSETRLQIIEKIKNLGYRFPVIISSDAVVNEDVQFGDGTVVFDGAVINSGSRLGSYCIINTGAIVEHDCLIDDLVHIAPRAVLSGGVKVGMQSMVGCGAVVLQRKQIGQNCMIGAGAVVVRDCMVFGTYVGVPARKI